VAFAHESTPAPEASVHADAPQRRGEGERGKGKEKERNRRRTKNRPKKNVDAGGKPEAVRIMHVLPSSRCQLLLPGAFGSAPTMPKGEGKERKKKKGGGKRTLLGAQNRRRRTGRRYQLPSAEHLDLGIVPDLSAFRRPRRPTKPGSSHGKGGGEGGEEREKKKKGRGRGGGGKREISLRRPQPRRILPLLRPVPSSSNV